MTNREKSLAQAEKYLTENKLDKAVKEYQKILDEEPNNSRVKLKIADLYAKKKEREKAVTLYREVGEAYEQENFHLKAIAVYKTVLKLNPTLVEINEKLGDLYKKVGLEKEAQHQYLIIGDYYERKGMSAEGLEIQKKIVALDPSSAPNIIRLAEFFQKEKQTEESVREYERAAAIYKKTKNIGGLIEVFEKVLYFRPNNIPMLRALLKIYFDRKEHDKIIKRLDAVAEELKNDVGIQQVWAETLVERQQMEAARKKFRELYQSCVRLKDEERSAYVYARILREFSDDADYLKEIDQIRKAAKFSHPILEPSYRADLESTQMMDTTKFQERK
ncbi:MAG: tetratricopeptide repeat protein [bacterium]|nr:tetratricopeptide repeat protein [bacterium]